MGQSAGSTAGCNQTVMAMELWRCQDPPHCLSSVSFLHYYFFLVVALFIFFLSPLIIRLLHGSLVKCEITTKPLSVNWSVRDYWTWVFTTFLKNSQGKNLRRIYVCTIEDDVTNWKKKKNKTTYFASEKCPCILPYWHKIYNLAVEFDEVSGHLLKVKSIFMFSTRIQVPVIKIVIFLYITIYCVLYVK